jgi:hypothetical protein
VAIGQSVSGVGGDGGRIEGRPVEDIANGTIGVIVGNLAGWDGGRIEGRLVDCGVTGGNPDDSKGGRIEGRPVE